MSGNKNHLSPGRKRYLNYIIRERLTKKEIVLRLVGSHIDDVDEAQNQALQTAIKRKWLQINGQSGYIQRGSRWPGDCT